mmetsp:Transcript_20744/g.20092  ORF Transcript_20744/g.20092 Transcript_20744/m.20092 type:complete len:83 (+) Transcript_20744:716-964(+)
MGKLNFSPLSISLIRTTTTDVILIVSLRVSPKDADGRDPDIMAIGTLLENFQKFCFQEAANFKRSLSDENKINYFTVVCSYY